MITISLISKVFLFLYIVENCHGYQKSRRCDYGICEQDDEYPEGEIWQKLQGSKDLRSYFGAMHITEAVRLKDSTASRISGNSETVCGSHRKLFFPKSMLNVKNQKKYLINIANTNYTMQLVSEICSPSYRGCRGEFCPRRCKGQFPGGNARCVQKYGILKLLSYQRGDEDFLYDLFRYPSACVCKILR